MKTKFLVTGAGGEGAICLIRILKNLGIEVFTCDITEFASGLYLADKWFLVPKAKEKEAFINEIKKIVSENKINAVLCMVHDELPIFATIKKELKEKYNCEIISSPIETVEICNDKLKTINFFKNIIPCPEVYDGNYKFPCFVKPRNSSGTKNAFTANSKEELDAIFTILRNKGIKKDEVIVQEYLSGKEYTADVLCDLNGNLIIAVPRQRILTKGGISTIGKTEKNDKILSFIDKIVNTLKFNGPANIQFKEDSSGTPKLLEINPRFSGGLTITLLSGVNIVRLLLKILNNEKLEKKELEWNEKLIFRHLTEIIQ